MLVDVDIENKTLSGHGEIDHSSFYNKEDGDTGWWHSYSTSIRRSIFMGDFVYAFSALGISVHDTEDLVVTEILEIPGQERPFGQDSTESEDMESEGHNCNDNDEGATGCVD